MRTHTCGRICQDATCELIGQNAVARYMARVCAHSVLTCADCIPPPAAVSGASFSFRERKLNIRELHCSTVFGAGRCRTLHPCRTLVQPAQFT